MFTYAYQQPSEYHFSLDSIHLAEYIAAELKSRADLSQLKVLDLCAGCGVIGMELSWYLRELKMIDFVEVQEVYEDFFRKNCHIINRPELILQWHLLNYDKLLTPSWQNKYDLIVSNPPYFFPHQGILSPSEFKNRCRFYLDSSFENYIGAVVNSLAVNGRAYFLLRPLKHHGCELSDLIESYIPESIVLKKATQIRGNDVFMLEKKSHNSNLLTNQ